MPKSSPPPSPAATSSHPWLIGLVVLAIITGTVFLVRGVMSDASSPEAPPVASTAPVTTSPPSTTTSVAAPKPLPPAPAPAGPAAVKTPAQGPLPPLPMLGFVPPRPIDVVRAVFEFAARRPDVLEYVPCFCGCERSGHVGNDDCFVKSRDAKGNVEWDPHGMS